MKVEKYKKYITWNIMSGIGYVASAIAIIFLMMYIIASSPLNMRADLNVYFYDYIVNHIVLPFINFYKFELTLLLSLGIISIYEHRHYVKNQMFGQRFFCDNENAYSKVFLTGLILNIFPVYLFAIIVCSGFIQFM